MAAPFKLSLVGKFSFIRPPIDIICKFFVALSLKGNVEIYLLDPRHILIQFHLEEDYTIIWIRQSWFIDGKAIRVFKWSTTFHSSEESPIVHVWVSLLFLPVHYIICKQALYSIVATIGKPLRIDHATASVSRPTIARVLIEYDVSKPLLKRLWIGEKDTSFWQYIIFEKVPHYCATCKHLGHSDDTCYINKPELRNAARVGPVKKNVVNVQGNKSKEPIKTQYVQKVDNKKQNAATNEATNQSAHDTSTVATAGFVATVLPLPVVHDVSTTNAETSKATNEVTTTEATHVISSHSHVVADVIPSTIVTLPSVMRAPPELMCSDLVPVVDKTDSGFGLPAVTAVGSMATTSTPSKALGPLSSDLVPYVEMTGGGFNFCDAPAQDPYRFQ